MSKRIVDLEATGVKASDDYLAVDSATAGTRKIDPSVLVTQTNAYSTLNNRITQLAGNMDVMGDEINENYSILSSQIGDLTSLETDDKSSAVNAVNELKADIGDLSELETTDKSSLVNAINEARGTGGGGLTEDVKVALLNCFDHVTWDDDDPTGQSYIDVLEQALYPPADLVSISAVYTQSGTVYDTDTLDSLKADLVVTALYDDSTTETVTTYTLSGTLATGTSTITVAYGGMTDTFTVTVTHIVSEENLTFADDLSTAPNAGQAIDSTTFETVSTTNEWVVASTIKASTLSFTWNTEESNAFQIKIAQYDENGSPYKISNKSAYSSSPITDGSVMTWTNAGGSAYFTAIGGGNIQIALPTSGVVKVAVRRSSATGTMNSNALFAQWLSNGGLTITAHV